MCKHWATVIKGTPSFWAELDGLLNQDEWERNLRKSEAHPLFLHIEYSFPVKSGLIAAAAAKYSRWQRVWLSDITPNTDLSFLDSSPSPSLELLLPAQGSEPWPQATVTAAAARTRAAPIPKVALPSRSSAQMAQTRGTVVSSAAALICSAQVRLQQTIQFFYEIERVRASSPPHGERKGHGLST